MKKVLLAFVAVFAMGIAANAQQAIGVRFGSNGGFGAELSYQKDLGANRLELDLGLTASSSNGVNDLNFCLNGIYQWKGAIAPVPNLGWYAGVGGMLGLYTWSTPHDSDTYFNLGVVGQAGLEYNFQALPIQVSLDWRPTMYLFNSEGLNIHFGWAGVALGVRYRF